MYGLLLLVFKQPTSRHLLTVEQYCESTNYVQGASTQNNFNFV
jgi:hypothetical protein